MIHIIRFAIIFAIRPATRCDSLLSTITCLPFAMNSRHNIMKTYFSKRIGVQENNSRTLQVSKERIWRIIQWFVCLLAWLPVRRRFLKSQFFIVNGIQPEHWEHSRLNCLSHWRRLGARFWGASTPKKNLPSPLKCEIGRDSGGLSWK